MIHSDPLLAEMVGRLRWERKDRLTPPRICGSDGVSRLPPPRSLEAAKKDLAERERSLGRRS